MCLPLKEVFNSPAFSPVNSLLSFSPSLSFFLQSARHQGLSLFHFPPLFSPQFSPVLAHSRHFSPTVTLCLLQRLLQHSVVSLSLLSFSLLFFLSPLFSPAFASLTWWSAKNEAKRETRERERERLVSRSSSAWSRAPHTQPAAGLWLELTRSLTVRVNATTVLLRQWRRSAGKWKPNTGHHWTAISPNTADYIEWRIANFTFNGSTSPLLNPHFWLGRSNGYTVCSSV